MESINLIAINPKVRRGRPYIVGTSVTVADVAIAHVYHSQDADGVANWYALSLSQVYAALPCRITMITKPKSTSKFIPKFAAPPN